MSAGRGTCPRLMSPLHTDDACRPCPKLDEAGVEYVRCVQQASVLGIHILIGSTPLQMLTEAAAGAAIALWVGRALVPISLLSPRCLQERSGNQ